jgi:hypothetical protein
VNGGNEAFLSFCFCGLKASDAGKSKLEGNALSKTSVAEVNSHDEKGTKMPAVTCGVILLFHPYVKSRYVL